MNDKTQNPQEENELVVIEFKPEIFDPRKESLQEIAAEVAKIEADPAKMDKDTLELVNTTKNKLVKARTTIEKTGKALRDPHTAYNKQVKAYEDELIAIIEPEEQRLKEIEKDAKEVAIKEERRKTLPEFKEKLAGIGDGIGIETDTDTNQEEYEAFLLTLDPDGRDRYYNERLGAHLEAKKAADEAREAEERAVKEAEQKKIDEEKAEIEREKNAMRLEKINGRKQRLFVAGFLEEVTAAGRAYCYDTELHISEQQLEDISDEEFNKWFAQAEVYVAADKKKKADEAEAKRQADIKEAEEKAAKEAKEEAERKAAEEEAKRQQEQEATRKAEEEAKAKEEAERKERESKEEYQQWLNEHSYDEKIHKIEEKDGTYTLYQWIASYTPEA